MRRCSSRPPRFDVGDAAAAFQEMLRTRLLPPVVDFNKKLSDVVRAKEYGVALNMLDEMILRKSPVDHCTLSIAIGIFCQLKRVDHGFAVLGSLFKRGVEPNVVTYTTLIKGLFSTGKIYEQ